MPKGNFMFNGKIVENPKDTTFAKLFIKDESKIVMLCASLDSYGDPKIWHRFKTHVYNDYTIMSTGNWEGIEFHPKRDIWFFGFGLYADKNNNDMPLEI